jgi:hypothetical protein
MSAGLVAMNRTLVNVRLAVIPLPGINLSPALTASMGLARDDVAVADDGDKAVIVVDHAHGLASSAWYASREWR